MCGLSFSLHEWYDIQVRGVPGREREASQEHEMLGRTLRWTNDGSVENRGQNFDIRSQLALQHRGGDVGRRGTWKRVHGTAAATATFMKVTVVHSVVRKQDTVGDELQVSYMMGSTCWCDA